MSDIVGTIGRQGGKPAASASDLIKDSDQTAFVADVIEASKEVPVLVDFWAPWCGPCKQLGPAIEQAVIQAGGEVKLVKINVDENQAIAQQMRVQSIPAVFAFANGKPVDGFMGAKPAGELKKFIEKVISEHGGKQDPQVQALLEQAGAAIEQNEIAAAGNIYAQILQADHENLDAIIGLAKSHTLLGDLEAARATLALVPPSKADQPDVKSVAAMLELASNRIDDDQVQKLEARIEKNPNDFEARFELANALNAAGERSKALDQLLFIVEKDRSWNDEAARKQILTYFEAWGPTDENTLTGRRRLSTVLFS